MRFVVVGSLLGFCLALAGLAFLDLGWLAAAAIWLLSGPISVVVAIGSHLARQPRSRAELAQPPVAQRQAA